MERKMKYEIPKLILLRSDDVILTSLTDGGTGSGIEQPHSADPASIEEI